MVSKAQEIVQYRRCHAMPGHDLCVLTISFNCFSRLSAKWPCPWPDCAIAAILRLVEVDVAVVSCRSRLVCAKEFMWASKSKSKRRND